MERRTSSGSRPPGSSSTHAASGLGYYADSRSGAGSRSGFGARGSQRTRTRPKWLNAPVGTAQASQAWSASLRGDYEAHAATAQGHRSGSSDWTNGRGTSKGSSRASNRSSSRPVSVGRSGPSKDSVVDGPPVGPKESYFRVPDHTTQPLCQRHADQRESSSAVLLSPQVTSEMLSELLRFGQQQKTVDSGNDGGHLPSEQLTGHSDRRRICYASPGSKGHISKRDINAVAEFDFGSSSGGVGEKRQKKIFTAMTGTDGGPPYRNVPDDEDGTTCGGVSRPPKASKAGAPRRPPGAPQKRPDTGGLQADAEEYGDHQEYDPAHKTSLRNRPPPSPAREALSVSLGPAVFDAWARYARSAADFRRARVIVLDGLLRRSLLRHLKNVWNDLVCAFRISKFRERRAQFSLEEFAGNGFAASGAGNGDREPGRFGERGWTGGRGAGGLPHHYHTEVW